MAVCKVGASLVMQVSSPTDSKKFVGLAREVIDKLSPNNVLEALTESLRRLSTDSTSRELPNG